MLLSELRVCVYSELAACLQQPCHDAGDDPDKPWWVVMAETCIGLDITRQEQMEIGDFIYRCYHLQSHIKLKNLSTHCSW